MSSSGDSVVSVNLQGKECSQPMVLHLMPCEINASGANKAKVDCYFTSTVKEDGPNGRVACLIASYCNCGIDSMYIYIHIYIENALSMLWYGRQDSVVM